MRKEGEQRREHLLDKAKQLQERANIHKAKVSQAVSPPYWCQLVLIRRFDANLTRTDFIILLFKIGFQSSSPF